MTGIDGLLAKLKRWLKGPPGVVLPPGTTLLKSDGLVPRGFRHGIELLNDDYTPIEFVVTVLESSAGLRHTEAVHAMLRSSLERRQTYPDGHTRRSRASCRSNFCCCSAKQSSPCVSRCERRIVRLRESLRSRRLLCRRSRSTSRSRAGRSRAASASRRGRPCRRQWRMPSSMRRGSG